MTVHTKLMFHGQPLTKREVLIARQAYDDGYDDGIGDRGVRPHGWRERGKERYPLPKAMRPRVVRDGAGMAFKLVDGVLHWSPSDGLWTSVKDGRFLTPTLTQSRVEVLADLLANPTEEVEIEDDERAAAIAKDDYYNRDGYAVWEDTP